MKRNITIGSKSLVESMEKISNEKNVTNFGYVEVYELLDYDGADGRCNSSSGFVTFNKNVADAWCQFQNGNSTKSVKGVLIKSLDEIKDARVEVEKLKALSKLSDREKKLLGL